MEINTNPWSEMYTEQEQAQLTSILKWMMIQKEWTECPITDSRSIYYHVAPMTYAKMIMNYVNENVQQP